MTIESFYTFSLNRQRRNAKLVRCFLLPYCERLLLYLLSSITTIVIINSNCPLITCSFPYMNSMVQTLTLFGLGYEIHIDA